MPQQPTPPQKISTEAAAAAPAGHNQRRDRLGMRHNVQLRRFLDSQQAAIAAAHQSNTDREPVQHVTATTTTTPANTKNQRTKNHTEAKPAAASPSTTTTSHNNPPRQRRPSAGKHPHNSKPSATAAAAATSATATDNHAQHPAQVVLFSDTIKIRTVDDSFLRDALAHQGQKGRFLSASQQQHLADTQSQKHIPGQHAHGKHKAKTKDNQHKRAFGRSLFRRGSAAVEASPEEAQKNTQDEAGIAAAAETPTAATTTAAGLQDKQNGNTAAAAASMQQRKRALTVDASHQQQQQRRKQQHQTTARPSHHTYETPQLPLPPRPVIEDATMIVTNTTVYLFPPLLQVDGQKFCVFNSYETFMLQDLLLVSLPYDADISALGQDYARRMNEFCLHLRGSRDIWCVARDEAREEVVDWLCDAYTLAMGISLDLHHPEYIPLIRGVMDGSIQNDITDMRLEWWAKAGACVKQGWLSYFCESGKCSERDGHFTRDEWIRIALESPQHHHLGSQQEQQVNGGDGMNVDAGSSLPPLHAASYSAGAMGRRGSSAAVDMGPVATLQKKDAAKGSIRKRSQRQRKMKYAFGRSAPPGSAMDAIQRIESVQRKLDKLRVSPRRVTASRWAEAITGLSTSDLQELPAWSVSALDEGIVSWPKRWFALTRDNYLLRFSSPEEMEAFQFIAEKQAFSKIATNRFIQLSLPASFVTNQIDITRAEVVISHAHLSPPGFEVWCRRDDEPDQHWRRHRRGSSRDAVGTTDADSTQKKESSFGVLRHVFVASGLQNGDSKATEQEESMREWIGLVTTALSSTLCLVTNSEEGGAGDAAASCDVKYETDGERVAASPFASASATAFGARKTRLGLRDRLQQRHARRAHVKSDTQRRTSRFLNLMHRSSGKTGALREWIEPQQHDTRQ